ncbi:MAG TPA: CopG family transcriptional regulator [Steroidobacteraceae bacterium]|nr:CopG family transcriptional regulator [Steroidobacteraceae bacterium]
MKAKIFDRKFDDAENIIEHLDLSKVRRVGTDPKRVNVDFPGWMVDSLDREARRLGVTRQALIKLWLADRLGQKAAAGNRRS